MRAIEEIIADLKTHDDPKFQATYSKKCRTSDLRKTPLRWLSSKEKLSVIKHWRVLCISAKRPPGNQGGDGYVDQEVIKLVNSINRMRGLCVVQSCCGHRRCSEGVEYFDAAHLWLRMSLTQSRVFQLNSFRLACSDLIENVSTIYGRDGKEVVAVSFRGMEYGDDVFKKSSRLIRGFFSEISGGAR